MDLSASKQHWFKSWTSSAVQTQPWLSWSELDNHLRARDKRIWVMSFQNSKPRRSLYSLAITSHSVQSQAPIELDRPCILAQQDSDEIGKDRSWLTILWFFISYQYISWGSPLLSALSLFWGCLVKCIGRKLEELFRKARGFGCSF